MEKAERKTFRCAVYTRKSVEDGLDMEFNSLDAQREAAENYIASQKANGWVLLPDRYDDGGFSGGNMNRPALKRLLVDCEAGKVDIIVVYKIDRLSRSICDFAELSKQFDKWNVAFVSVTQEINTHTSAGRMMLNILMTFAQFEREVIAERVRDKMAASRLKGKWVGGNVTLGYKVENHRLVIVPEEAETVRFIFRRFIETQSLKQVGRELEEHGLQPKHGKSWNTQILYRLLNNYAYIGKVKYSGQVVEGEHEAIVSEDDWAEVQSLMEERSLAKDGERRTETSAPLKGILRCGHCGGALSPVWCAKGNRRYFYYKCVVDSRRTISSCPVKQVSAGEVEGLVYRQLQLVLASPEIQIAVAEVSGRSPSDVAAFLGSELWERMTMPERGRLARLLVKEAVLREDGITLEIRTEGIEALIKEALDETNS
ncbi:MAG: recombinase family protein [Kiritimatiellae bacterium]|nr:recombinase family protein [Kiritimatiellia bacterium]